MEKQKLRHDTNITRGELTLNRIAIDETAVYQRSERGHPDPRHIGPRKRIVSGLAIAEPMSAGAANLIKALVWPVSDPRHVCGPECFAEH
jgi:hypothetical protein